MGASKNITSIKVRSNKTRTEDLPISKLLESQIGNIAHSLARQIDKENFNKKYATAAAILKLVGTGAFLTASIAVPNLPQILKPFLNKEDEYEAWKRFNIPYLRRTIERLERQKLVSVKIEGKQQIVEITNAGRRKILKFSLDELTVEKPKYWDGKWRLVSYDVPNIYKTLREIFNEYLKAWRFYPLHKSVFLHAYPCNNQIEYLRQYLGIGEYVRIFQVTSIENDMLFKDFFGI